MYSTQAWAAHYGLPLNTPDEFVQGYVDAMRLDAKGQGKPCGRGFIAPGKKCSTKGRQQLASDLRSGDLGAKARVATGKRNAQAQQAARRQERKQAEREKVWGKKRATPKESQEYAITSKSDPMGWNPTEIKRTRLVKGRKSGTSDLRKGGKVGTRSATMEQSRQGLIAERQQRRERTKASAEESAAKAAKQAKREKTWGSRVEPKSGQDYAVKIPKGGGKARVTRSFKGRSSSTNQARRGLGDGAKVVNQERIRS